MYSEMPFMIVELQQRPAVFLHLKDVVTIDVCNLFLHYRTHTSPTLIFTALVAPLPPNSRLRATQQLAPRLLTNALVQVHRQVLFFLETIKQSFASLNHGNQGGSYDTRTALCRHLEFEFHCRRWPLPHIIVDLPCTSSGAQRLMPTGFLELIDMSTAGTCRTGNMPHLNCNQGKIRASST